MHCGKPKLLTGSRNSYFSLDKFTHGQYKNRRRIERKNKKAVDPRDKDSGFDVSEFSFADSAPACRVYGSINVKKVTANLHISTYVPSFVAGSTQYDSGINMSHIIHEFSFGDYFPAIAEPLDSSMEMTDDRTSRLLTTQPSPCTNTSCLSCPPNILLVAACLIPTSTA